MNELMKDLSREKDAYGNTFSFLFYANSGVDNNADAQRIRRIAKKHGYKCRLEMAYRLSINFVKL
jgi:hypothetical protein